MRLGQPFVGMNGFADLLLCEIPTSFLRSPD